MFQDDLVCILKPEVKKGIIIWTQYQQPSGMDSLCTIGLKTAKQLHTENIQFGRDKSVQHSYIFFRAPYLSNIIDYTSIDSEINSLYGPQQSNRPNRVYIRVDPDKTYVFSSEIRARYNPTKYHSMLDELIRSKKTLTTYLDIINKNSKIKITSSYVPIYNLYDSHKELIIKNYDDGDYDNGDDDDEDDATYPYSSHDIERNSEILVTMPHLTPDYFVKCT